jgi:hypothetical protein
MRSDSASGAAAGGGKSGIAASDVTASSDRASDDDNIFKELQGIGNNLAVTVKITVFDNAARAATFKAIERFLYYR